MKNKWLKISIIILLLFIIYSILNYFKSEKSFQKSYTSSINSIDFNAIMADVFELYYNSDLECVKTVNEFSGFKNYPKSYKQEFIDYFSNDTSSLLYYIPIYDLNTKKREAFLLLSSGIDGEINNKINWTDTLYKQQIKDKISLYNWRELKKYYLLDSIFQYSYKEYLFGGKDILVMYGDCFEYYKMLGKGVFNMKYFTEFIKNKRLGLNKIVNIQLTDYKIEGSKIITDASQYKIEANITSSKFGSYIPINDTVYVTGRLSKINYDSRYILIENAVIYPSGQLGDIPNSK